MKPELWPNGGRRRPPGGWKKFTEAVEEAARTTRRRPKRVHPNSLANLELGRQPIAYKRQCIATALSTGQRCKRGAAAGAERCTKHGGALEAPAHPANLKALANGRLQSGWAAAREAFNRYDRATRETVHQAYRRAKPRGRHWPTLLAGAQALHADTAGKAFRAWLQTLKTQD